jgi:hypothetical protein
MACRRERFAARGRGAGLVLDRRRLEGRPHRGLEEGGAALPGRSDAGRLQHVQRAAPDPDPARSVRDALHVPVLCGGDLPHRARRPQPPLHRRESPVRRSPHRRGSDRRHGRRLLAAPLPGVADAAAVRALRARRRGRPGAGPRRRARAMGAPLWFGEVGFDHDARGRPRSKTRTSTPWPAPARAGRGGSAGRTADGGSGTSPAACSRWRCRRHTTISRWWWAGPACCCRPHRRAAHASPGRRGSRQEPA